MSPIQRGLKDRHPYVRRTAVMGVLKVHNFDADAVRNSGASRASLIFFIKIFKTKLPTAAADSSRSFAELLA